MLRQQPTYLQGSFTFQNYDDEPITINVDGRYTISTIPALRGSETILFKDTGIGPDQIELWYRVGHPTAEIVNDELDAGRFSVQVLS